MDERTFLEVTAAVIYKIQNKIPMTTAKEEFLEDVIQDWAEIWGYETLTN